MIKFLNCPIGTVLIVTVLQRFQMRILHEETPFSEEEKKQKRDEIRLNVKESIITILNAMPVVDPPVRCADPENEARRAWMLSECAKPDFDYPPHFWEATSFLWKDAGVQVFQGSL